MAHMKNTNRVFASVTFALGIFVMISVLTFARPCNHDTALRNGLCIAGGAVALVSIVNMFRPNLVCALLNVLGGLFLLIAPGTWLKTCTVQGMRCLTYTKPLATVAGVILMAAAVWQAALMLIDALKGKRA